MQGFISGGDTGIDPDALARRRKILDAMGQQNGAPRNVGEGLAAIGKALAYRIGNKRLEQQEAKLSQMQATAKYDPNTSDVTRALLGIPGYAKGTAYHPGGLAVVGEQGPELLNLPRGSQVIPNQLAQNIPPDYQQQMQDMQPQEQERTRTLIQEGESLPEAFAPEGYNPYDMMRESALGGPTGIRTADASGYLEGTDLGKLKTDYAANVGDALKIKHALMSMFESLDDYETIFANGGGSVVPGPQRDQLVTQRRAIQMQMKDLYNLGALQGPDLALLEGLMVDPTSIGANAVDFLSGNLKDRFTTNTKQIRDIMLDLAAPRLREYGIDPAEFIGKRRPVEEMDDDAFLKSLGIE